MKKLRFLFLFFILTGIFFTLTACVNHDEPAAEPVKYTITYNTNTTPAVVSKSYEENTVLTENQIDIALEKEGYTKEYWYLDSSFTTKVIFPYTITKNESFYLNWTKNNEEEKTYTVSFMDGNTLITEVQTVNYQVSQPQNPQKTGYTFVCWVDEAGTAFDFTNQITQDITLYAKFEIISLTVKFMDSAAVISSKAIDYGTAVSAVNAPEKTGYTFIGWTDKAGTAFDFSKPITEDTEIYAKYEIIQLKVEFMDGTKVLSTETINYGQTAAMPSETPQKDGYIFDNWYTDTEYTDVFEFTSKIVEDTKIYAKFNQIIEGQINITKSGGYNEGAYVEFSKLADVSLENYEVYYKKANAASETKIDSELIREGDTAIRADIVGLAAGTYDITVKVSGTDMSKTLSGVEVYEDDRSGYAHFNNASGIGAYKNDGTLKSNAVVVYVNDSNKNTVTATLGGKQYTGLVNIIKACTKSSYVLDIRILGEIQTTQWNAKTHGTGNTAARQNQLEETFNYTNDSSGWDESSSSNYSKLSAEQIIAKGINSMSNDEAKGITMLEGLTSNVLRNKKATSNGYEYDSYWNMLDVSGAYNITIEGIGTDAAIFQWGFAFKKCNSIEIKNIYFHDYTEDAVGFEGASNSDTDYGNYWIHNCTFDIGVNNWDVCYEADKGDGDGSTDLKYCHNVTVSYCQYNKTHKTNLIGSSDSALQYNITLHHNYYNECGSRLPLVRQANIHIYNNYYYKSTGYCSSIRANAFAFVENNYYDNAKNPYETVSSGALKAFGNIYDNCTTSGSYTKQNTVSSRTEAVSGTCNPTGSADYSNFDTNAGIFYYDTVNQVSDVKNLLDANDVPSHCKEYSGVLKGTFTGIPSPDEDDEPTETVWQTVLNQDFSTNTTITQIASGTAPSAAGIYSYTNGSDTSANNLSISDGVLNINDTSSTDTTYGYYIFENAYSTGKVRISIDFMPQTSNGKWTMIHFLDGQSNIGIRTDSSKYLGYTIDGGTTVNPILSEVLSPSTTYTIVLTIDYTTNKAVVGINDTELTISGYANAITGIMFQTASGIRSFSVDNLKIETA